MKSASASYFVLQVHQLPASSEDLLTYLCFEWGAEGISEVLEFSQAGKDYEPVTIEKPTKSIEVFFAKAPSPLIVETLLSAVPSLEIELKECPELDWLEEWKKGFEPFPLVENIWVVPSWLKAPAQAGRSIQIDPGMAFGTGTHETTQLAAKLMSEAFLDLTSPRVLDVGTGTGILALLAELLGADEVVATEIDPEARWVARENLVINSSFKTQVVDIQIDQVDSPSSGPLQPGSFDLVVANIIDGVLLDLEPYLWRLLRPSGQLILTGILAERERGFCSSFCLPQGRHWKGREQKGEWVGFRI